MHNVLDNYRSAYQIFGDATFFAQKIIYSILLSIIIILIDYIAFALQPHHKHIVANSEV